MKSLFWPIIVSVVPHPARHLRHQFPRHSITATNTNTFPHHSSWTLWVIERKKMKVFYRKDVLTTADRSLADHLGSLRHEQRLQWNRDQIATYRVGDPIKAVLGGYRGLWLYGKVTEVNQTHVAFQTATDTTTYVAQPGPASGLQHISQEELEAANAGQWCDKSNI